MPRIVAPGDNASGIRPATCNDTIATFHEVMRQQNLSLVSDDRLNGIHGLRYEDDERRVYLFSNADGGQLDRILVFLSDVNEDENEGSDEEPAYRVTWWTHWVGATFTRTDSPWETVERYVSSLLAGRFGDALLELRRVASESEVGWRRRVRLFLSKRIVDKFTLCLQWGKPTVFKSKDIPPVMMINPGFRWHSCSYPRGIYYESDGGEWRLLWSNEASYATLPMHSAGFMSMPMSTRRGWMALGKAGGDSSARSQV